MVEIGTKIKELREAKKMTQKDLAERDAASRLQVGAK